MVKTIYFDRKQCTQCHKYRLLVDFHKHRLHKDGRSTICKECRKKKDRVKEYNTKATKRKQAMLDLKELDGCLLREYFLGASLYLDKDGYFVLEQGYTRVRRSRVIFCYEHGIRLKDIDHLEIHHVNGNRQFDDKSNLMCISKSEHIKLYHNSGGKVGDAKC